jgi:hypothetical protein
MMAKTAGSVSANFCDGVSSSITRITQDVFAITVTGGLSESGLFAKNLAFGQGCKMGILTQKISTSPV